MFLSSRIDSLRRPYGRAIEDFSRTSVFVGSTNRHDLLHDLASASPIHRLFGAIGAIGLSDCGSGGGLAFLRHRSICKELMFKYIFG